MSGSSHNGHESNFASFIADLERLRLRARQQRQFALIQRDRLIAARAGLAKLTECDTARDAPDAASRLDGVSAPALVGFAASAGGLSPLVAALEPLPRDFQAAVVVAFHSAGGRALPSILEPRCRLSVKFAESGELIRSGMVYLAPPQQHVIVNANRTFALADRPRRRFVRPSADWLFHTMAATYGGSAVAIVLSGYQRDGARGLVSVHRAGGFTIVQDPDSCEAPGMPIAAIATGLVSRIARPELIAHAILASLADLDVVRCQQEFDNPFAATA